MKIPKTLSPFLTACIVVACMTPLAAKENNQSSPITSPAGDTTAKPGTSKPIVLSTQVEDIHITNDEKTAREQVKKYPGDPEAYFVLAVALTRTSKVEEAFVVINKCRRLAKKHGGSTYFDKLIDEYEKLLTYQPDDNRVRYHLSWAYYMKAYLLGQNARGEFKWHCERDAKLQAAFDRELKKKKEQLGGKRIVSTLEELKIAQKLRPGSTPNVIPQVKKYFESALAKLDQIAASDPTDLAVTVYSAHLRAEYTGNLDAAMKVWKQCQLKHPNHPGPYFFLGEGYLKQGNLKESLSHVSRAIALRSLGN